MAAVNKQAIAVAFGRVATHYEQYVSLQCQNTDILLAVLLRHRCTHVLDAGYGPGWMGRHWRERHAQMMALDLSPPMLVRACQKDAADHYLAGDIESLPLATAAFDLAWSSLAVQWCDNLSVALRKLYRAMRPKDTIAFITLVQGSLLELHQAWQTVDKRPHANRFLPPDEIEQSLGGVHYQHHIQPITLRSDDTLNAMRSLKGIGTTHLHEGRGPRILTRSQLQRLQLAQPQQQG